MGAKSSRSSVSSRSRAAKKRYVVCLSNKGYPVSLEPRKIYASLVDHEAEQIGFLRVVDESGEDYLFPEVLFAEIEVSASLARALAAA